MLRLLLAALLCLAAPAAIADRLGTYSAIYAEVRDAFRARNYDRIDALADSWRGGARMESGGWRLAGMYSVFRDRAFPEGSKHEGGSTKVDIAAYDRLLEQIDAWIEARPGSIAAPVAKAVVLADRGWQKRGGGYAHEVSEAAMQAFAEDQMLAFAVLDASRDRAERDPEWHTILLSIYVAFGDRYGLEQASDRALQFHPGYQSLYAVIMGAHLPQWGGSPESMEAAARRIGASAAMIGEADIAYARAYWSVARDHSLSEEFFKDTRADWARMKRGFEAIVAAYPTDHNLNHFAWFACKGVDPALALQLLDRIGTSVVQDAWDYPEHPQHCRDWASQDRPPLAGERPDQTPIYVVMAFDSSADGTLRQVVEAVHADEGAVLAAARALVPAHRGVAAWKIIPSIAGQTYFKPELLFETGDTMTVEEMQGQAAGGR